MHKYVSTFVHGSKTTRNKKKKHEKKINNTRGQCYFSYLFIVQNIKNEINKDKKIKNWRHAQLKRKMDS